MSDDVDLMDEEDKRTQIDEETRKGMFLFETQPPSLEVAGPVIKQIPPIIKQTAQGARRIWRYQCEIKDRIGGVPQSASFSPVRSKQRDVRGHEAILWCVDIHGSMDSCSLEICSGGRWLDDDGFPLDDPMIEVVDEVDAYHLCRALTFVNSYRSLFSRKSSRKRS